MFYFNRAIFFLLFSLMISSSVSLGSEIHRAAEKGDTETILLLLKNNPKLVCLKDEYGEIPLHSAVRNLHYEASRLLVYYNSPLDTESKFGFTPLKIACQDSISLTSLLVSNGADVNRADAEGSRPLHVVHHYDIARYLIGRGANPAVKNNDGVTPLHNASYNGLTKLIALYVKHGAQINQADKMGETPLYYACSDGVEPSVRILLKLGANPGITNREGKTPLHIACDGVERMNLNIPRLLIEYGAMVNARDTLGKTPLYYAEKHFDPAFRKALVQLLKSKGAKL